MKNRRIFIIEHVDSDGLVILIERTYSPSKALRLLRRYCEGNGVSVCTWIDKDENAHKVGSRRWDASSYSAGCLQLVGHDRTSWLYLNA